MMVNASQLVMNITPLGSKRHVSLQEKKKKSLLWHSGSNLVLLHVPVTHKMSLIWNFRLTFALSSFSLPGLWEAVLLLCVVSYQRFLKEKSNCFPSWYNSKGLVSVPIDSLTMRRWLCDHTVTGFSSLWERPPLKWKVIRFRRVSSTSVLFSLRWRGSNALLSFPVQLCVFLLFALLVMIPG